MERPDSAIWKVKSTRAAPIARAVDDHHQVILLFRNGKQTGSPDGTISADGRVMTSVYTGLDTQGKESRQVRVWDKR